jgi:ABC-type multidrug transport system fused ATPase/permease subunit
MDVIEETKKSYGRLLSFIKPYKWRFINGLILSLMAGASTGVFLLLLNIVVGLVLRGETNIVREIPFIGTVDVDQILSPFVTPGGGRPDAMMVIQMSLGIPALMFLRGMLDYLATYKIAWVEQRIVMDLRCKLFEKVLDRSLGFFNKQRGGDLIQTVYMMTNLSAGAAMTLAKDLVRRPAAILSVVVMLLFLDPLFMFFSFIVFPLCILPVVYLSRKVRREGRNEQHESGRLIGGMQEAFNGIRVVKSHAREEFEMNRFLKVSRRMNANILRFRKAMELVGPLVETVASLGLAGGLFYCWYYQMPFEDFMTRCLALIAIYPDAKALSRTQMLMQRCAAATARVFEIMDHEPEIIDKPEAVTLEKCRGEITFRDVTFNYTGRTTPAVKGLSFSLQPGRFYALVGESGAGKSTIMSLLLRFYDPQKGSIQLDGHDIRDITQKSLRNHIGVVNQDLFLFHDSIANNIRYGRLEATDDEIRNAAEIAHAAAFIQEQPQGYETMVGDKGCNLSGGQQQRLTIARAIVRDAPILLLDEATSNLDPETEQAFKDALRILRQGRTVIAIAHRFSTIVEADEILVMDKGRVVEQGSHYDLMRRSKIYERLYRLQFEPPENTTLPE